MQQLIYCGLVAVGIFVGIVLTLFAIWLWNNEVYPEELEEDEN